MAKKKEEPLIHLRFQNIEAKRAKKDILSSEISLLKISKAIKNYQVLRIEELKRKEKIQSKMKTIKSDLTKLHKLLPKIKMPKILKKEEEKQKETKIPEKKKIKDVETYGTIEDQLRNIQERLQALNQ